MSLLGIIDPAGGRAELLVLRFERLKGSCHPLQPGIQEGIDPNLDGVYLSAQRGVFFRGAIDA